MPAAARRAWFRPPCVRRSAAPSAACPAGQAAEYRVAGSAPARTAFPSTRRRGPKTDATLSAAAGNRGLRCGLGRGGFGWRLCFGSESLGRERRLRGAAFQASARLSPVPGRGNRCRRGMRRFALKRAALMHIVVVFGRLGGHQRLPIGYRNPVVVGVNFTEGEEPVTVSAVFDERRLKRRFDPRYAGEVDVSFELLLGRSLKIEFFYRFPLTTTTRVSSGCVASTSMRLTIEINLQISGRDRSARRSRSALVEARRAIVRWRCGLRP